jgi:hypothetical protein
MVGRAERVFWRRKIIVDERGRFFVMFEAKGFKLSELESIQSIGAEVIKTEESAQTGTPK